MQSLLREPVLVSELAECVLMPELMLRNFALMPELAERVCVCSCPPRATHGFDCTPGVRPSAHSHCARY